MDYTIDKLEFSTFILRITTVDSKGGVELEAVAVVSYKILFFTL